MKPERPLKDRMQAKAIAAIRNAEMSGSGVVSCSEIFKRTGMVKRQLKKLVRDGWLKMVYVRGISGGAECRYYVNPDLRT